MPFDPASWAGGVLTTVLGSWISSWISGKVRVYEEARNNHRDELKQKILEPLRATLQRYSRPSFTIKWEAEQYNAQALSLENPATMGLKLSLSDDSDPGARAESNLDEALLEDARRIHHRELLASWERFRDSWTAHVRSRVEWIEEVAQTILSKSGLPAHPTAQPETPYIMHRALALFIYDRLMLTGKSSLVVLRYGGGTDVVLGDGNANLARGSPEQIDCLRRLIDELIGIQRGWATERQRELEKLESERASLSRQFSLAIAAKKLRRSCSLVRFF